MCDAGTLSSIVWANFLASGWFVHCYFLSCYFFPTCPLFLFPCYFFPSATLIESTELLLIFLIPVFLLAHCYFLSCYFFSYLPTVSFFPVTLFIQLPKWTVTFFLFLFSHLSTVTLFLVTFFPTWNCYFLSCFFFSHLSTVTFFPVTFFPVTFFPTWNCYFLSCYLFSCYFLSVHRVALSRTCMMNSLGFVIFFNIEVCMLDPYRSPLVIRYESS